jgi:hypothetical protein
MANLPTNTKQLSQRVRRKMMLEAVASPCDLTYKASVDQACTAANLEKYTGSLYGRCEWRYVYGSKDFIAWANAQLPGIVPERVESGTAAEQLEAEFYGFRDGLGLAYGTDIRCLETAVGCLEPLELGVWELKTPDIRLFGWFPDVNYFVVHSGAEKRKLPLKRDYAPFIAEIVRFRQSLVSFLPNHIIGGRLSDVISNRS